MDISFAREKGIQVLGVRDYGDEGLVEFILSELIRLFHGFGPHQWSEKQEELTGKTLGIMDRGGLGPYFEELTALENVIHTAKVTGFTRQADGRLSRKVIQNLERVI